MKLRIIVHIISLHKNIVLLSFLKCFRCYYNLKLPLTHNGKLENWHLLLSHCGYFDNSFLSEIFLSSPLPNISVLSKPLIFINCHGIRKAKFAKNKNK